MLLSWDRGLQILGVAGGFPQVRSLWSNIFEAELEKQGNPAALLFRSLEQLGRPDVVNATV